MICSENLDLDKINDLQNIPPTTCKKELQVFLILLTYLSPFIPNLTDKTYTMRVMLKKKVIFLWK